MRGRSKSIQRCRDIERREAAVWKAPPPTLHSACFLEGLRELFRCRRVAPSTDQPAFAIENENGELGGSRDDSKLRNGLTVEIRHHKDIVTRISINVQFGVFPLNFLRFLIEPIANHRRYHSTQRGKNALLEIDDIDEPNLRIPKSNFRHPFTDGVGLRFIAASDYRDDGDVAVRGRKLMAVDVGKGERIGVALV